FGRECVATNYEGRVPLILVDIHQEISNYLPDEDARRAYWKQPFVWDDIKSSFEKFFELNPEAVGWRHNYAWYANQCEQWASVMEQVRQFGSDTNYTYFGGKDAFDKMVKRAQAKAK